MNDHSPSRLEMLRFARSVTEQQIVQIDRWIEAEERRERERRVGQERRPTPPDWLLEHGLNRDALPSAVHVGGCHMAGKRSRGVGREEALRWLANGVVACTHCRPDTELGLLE
ncbi:DUF6233 domain-containing protein [Streptomyces scabiei]|uniref:DUF6233 domain-containing protein n=1 Tax=Streptomyces scabiei TaxID=1930 RepID=UPI0029B1D72C|nr:DUF6233 domain-containing protein [Streptomyces scabiei]MDX2800135.1 DUF6233 domain-containing protein [Streptomyces scabiei]MDX3127346.1 DUF6233 domain-containing protein [Streptomyces scabiei]